MYGLDVIRNITGFGRTPVSGADKNIWRRMLDCLFHFFRENARKCAARSEKRFFPPAVRWFPASGQVRRPPVLLFKAPAEKPAKTIKEDTQKETDDHESGKPLLCRFCRKKITYRGAAIEVNGAHKHVFANPGGFVFEIGCFRIAPGCVNHGAPTLEFTWFSGFTWRFSLCSRCHSHLGWHYLSKDSASFFGLIMSNLIEDKE